MTSLLNRNQHLLLTFAFTALLMLKYCEARCESNSILNGKSRCVVDCKWGNRVCECEAGYDECQFSLDIDEFYSFTSYEILGNEDTQVRGTHGVIYSISSTGHAVPVTTDGKCSNFANNPTYNCSIPNWTNSLNFKVIIGINGLLPGPTLIVDEGSTIIAYVNNNLTQEATSIHWHGMTQYNTPWMDGVSGVTQCPIKPDSNFQYIFIAEPSGTFWYHSHVGSQRADGCFGSLIIRENSDKIELVRDLLSSQYGIENFSDEPDVHTMIVNDWSDRTGVDNFLIQTGVFGDLSDTPLGMLPVVATEMHQHQKRQTHNQTDHSTDTITAHHHIPFHSALINGLGRHHSVPFIQSRLSEFSVEYGNTYRFRLIGAQADLLFRFSIDSHLLTVIATDGNFIEPIENVSYIIIHSGERYDFLLTANQPIGNYIMRLETTDLNVTDGSPPYEHLGEGTQAILHYKTALGDGGILSSNYEAIYNDSLPTLCDEVTPCRVVNCPFENFHPSYYSDCINVGDFRLLIETPYEELPVGDPDKEIFLNFNFEAHSITSSINGRKFVFPPSPILTQPNDFEEQALKCDLSANCNPSDLHCWCTHVVEVGYNKIIQLVVSAIGTSDHQHPFHFHGHHFHVLKVGYPSYSNTTNSILHHNDDIYCADSTCHHSCINTHCTQPSWANEVDGIISIDGKTPRKDTAIIPAGGYLVVRIITDNPGAWLVHCHILVHATDGMAMILNVAPDYQNPPPEGFPKCGNFKINTNQFYEKLQFVPSVGYRETSSFVLISTLFHFFFVAYLLSA